MKTQHNIFRITAAALAAATLLSGCMKDELKQKEQAAPNGEGEFELIVEVGEAPATKTTITRDGTILPVVWKEGDKLYVAGATDGYIGCMELEATQASGEGVGYHKAKFKGKMSGWTSTQVLHFYYLGSSEPTLTDNKFTFDISSQEGTLAWIQDSGHISHAATESALAPGSHTLSLTMNNMNAVILYDLSEWTSGVEISGTYNKAVLDLKDGTFDTTDCAGDIALAADKCTASSYVTFIPENGMELTFAKGVFSTPTRANNVAASKFYSDARKAIKIPCVCLDGYIEHNKNWGPGIEINGIIWAPVNCGIWDGEYPYGKLYQFGRKVGGGYNESGTSYVTEDMQENEPASSHWTSGGRNISPDDTKFYYGYDWYTGSHELQLSTWPMNASDPGYAERIANPCPNGWRVPTDAELLTLLGNVESSLATSVYELSDDCTIYGRRYYGNTSKTGNSIFLPAAGCRFWEDGHAYSRNTNGNYWSSCINTTNARFLAFQGESHSRMDSYTRAYGFSVRCVKDKEMPHYIETVNDTNYDYGPGIKVGNTIWAPVNCGVGVKDTDHPNGTYPYGKLYQWGRKYPCEYNASWTDGNGSHNAETVFQTAANGPIAESSEKSTEFYTTTDWPHDWLSPKNDNRWTVLGNNPCPNGWRVPTKSELTALIANKSGWRSGVSAVNGQNGYYFSGSNTYSETVPSIFLQAAGLRSSNNTSDHRGSNGCYYTSNVNGDYSYYYSFKSSENNWEESRRANGCSVRCVYCGE